ncbi:MAG: hypothetical protein GWO20_19070 [Candidatus Korarchaeota archaeon]|nr:hypothetical protein [Candidatus Korarchaeota archaeon]NIU85358.1 hypothetical protein [Candidatus Thorarchaeota archaeon]NIW15456.1 hypothetical protein [Candidatus Thorarchaeota archaeon]NIW53400.1 hypothetical protein [Candidatus Korarchaeota archaeon]
MALDPLLALKLTFILGWINLIGLLLVVLSCRCIPINLPASLQKTKAYQVFYKYHCYYWYLFLISVALHAILAITALSIPF